MSDSDAGERVPADCPGCNARTAHEVLKPGGHATVRCTECGHTHKIEIERPATTDVDVIVSQEGESYPTSLAANPEETVEVGDEFVVDTEAAIQQVRVTTVELGEERRVEEAQLGDVETVWTRVVDNVGVNVTVHPKDGRHDETRSLKVHVPGDFEFVVGDVERFGDDEFEIEGVQVRDEAEGYRREKFDHEGDMVFAKDVKRVYARDETTTAWSAW
ncbi:HVO_0476 family zinc finger protein [Halorarum halobium]|uniref:HVO_0476 family zinc finger protein n=1 Tax=Halorarum halobium TaxID=3075121 RepID=UPI0028ADBA4E|nr:HVO_0476 family zinc finger protein [Halobaculum sp. XH14]